MFQKRLSPRALGFGVPCRRVYLLSPAHCSGKRAQLVFNDRATFGLAQRLRTKPGVQLGEVFSFLSGLYFRGKLLYAQQFAHPPQRCSGELVITTNCGLVPAEKVVMIDDLRAMGRGDIDLNDVNYRTPLIRDARALAAAIGPRGQAVLLGSIATGKYVDILLELLGERLMFPVEFVGRGDMSRGGLLLRCVQEGRELTYVRVLGAVRKGSRPPKLVRRKIRPTVNSESQAPAKRVRPEKRSRH